MKLTREAVHRDLSALGQGYKTADVDRLIRSYVTAGADTSSLREYILKEQELHRIYFYVPLKQMKSPRERMEFIHENLLFSDWWHTDQLISFVADLDFEVALEYAKSYVENSDPFIRRWGYVLFISRLCRSGESLARILSLMKNDDHYYVVMAEAWLICELAVFFPDEILSWLTEESGLCYNITSRAVQKICDSYRVSDEMKSRFRALRPSLKRIGRK